jgi:hypothetical protein
VFSLKGCLKVIFCLALISRAFAMPDCGVCANPSSMLRAASSSPVPVLGEKKILYIRVNFPDDSSEPITTATAEDLMQQVDAFYRTHSYGQCRMKSTVTSLLQLPSPKSAYFITNSVTSRIDWHPFQILADARTVARASGYDPSQYDLEMVRLNGPLVQSWGNIGFSGAWMFSSHPASTVHEIGHNLGLYHANAWNGALNGAGENTEYGDRFDTMGNPYYYDLAGFNTVHKELLGWMGHSQETRVTSSGVYRLYAHDTNQLTAGRAYALRIRKDDEKDYWIEKRQSFNLSEDMELSGVLVYWDEWSQSNSGTHLLDPSAASGFALPVGASLADSGANVRVIPLRQSADRSYADVAVIFGSSALTILPGMLHFSGLPSTTYTIESSPDLTGWSNVQQISSASGDLLLPVDSSSPARFFRVR